MANFDENVQDVRSEEELLDAGIDPGDDAEGDDEEFEEEETDEEIA